MRGIANQIDSLTSQQGVRTFEWDSNRGGSDGAGDFLITKISFSKSGKFSNSDIEDYSSYRLSKMSVQEIANLFVTIVHSKNAVFSCGCHASACSVHMSGGKFLFVLGKIDPNFEGEHRLHAGNY